MSQPYIKKNYIGKTLENLIADLNPGRPIIIGKLRIAPGHDYWWFLEYGTGAYFEEPGGGELAPNAPASVLAADAEGPYDITAAEKPLLVYLSHGQVHRAKGVTHFGIQPLAIVRTSLFTAHIYLKEHLSLQRTRRRRGGWSSLPKRKDLVALINEAMEELLLQLQISSPVDKDTNEYHVDRPHSPTLAQAWHVTKAR